MKNKIVARFLTVTLLLANICFGFSLNLHMQNATATSFCGSGTAVEKSETINYSRKETEEYSIKYGVPTYLGQHGTGCANITGAVIIGYYDRFCEDLIPNCKTYIQLGTIIKYTSTSTEIFDLIDQLKELMGTDKDVEGTTFSGYQQGMRAYVNNHNYTYVTEDLGKLNFDKYVTAVQNNKPVSLFLNTFSILTNIQVNGSSEIVTDERTNIPHALVAFGYRIDTYYDSNNKVITTRTYLKVASGLTRYGVNYLCLDGKSKIEYAISTEIK